MTLSKVVLGLGISDFCHGLAISWVRALNDIACLTRISGERLKTLEGLNKIAEDLH